MIVGFQGEPGAYSEQAALEYFQERITTLPCKTFADVFHCLDEGHCERAFMPLENSLTGSIYQNYDLLLRHPFHICGEYHFRVSHCLLASPGVKLADIKRVHSHPQALAQCAANLESMGVEQVPEKDTAGSAHMLSQAGTRDAAALASRRAAQVYHLEILATHLEDNPANYTRFIALARQPYTSAETPEHGFKTTIVFGLPNQPGALYRALEIFARREINLSKIESRPIQGKPWEYLFYLDFAGHATSPPCLDALEKLEAATTFLRNLGSYPRHPFVSVKD